VQSTGGSSREQEEFERLRTALNAAAAENSRLRSSLRSQELQNERTSEELRTYKEALEKRDEENSSSRNNADDRNRAAMVNFARTHWHTRTHIRGKQPVCTHVLHAWQ
jgi:septal ring factor EnvC (AmiA/AmiB activator)